MMQQKLSSTQLSFWQYRLTHGSECARATGRLMGWYELALDPLMSTQLLSDPPALQARLVWLRERLHMWLAGTDERQAAEILLCFLELSLLTDPDFEPGLVERRLMQIDNAATGEQSGLMQAYGRIVLAGLFCGHVQLNISHDRFRQLQQQIPSGRGNLEIWYGAALWAYHNRHMDVLEEALEFCVMGYPGCVDEQVWRMCNLMYRLSSGRAISKDVECLIQCFEHPVQLSQFREDLLADCNAAGLMNPEMQYCLDRRERELHRGALTISEDVRAVG